VKIGNFVLRYFLVTETVFMKLIIWV